MRNATKNDRSTPAVVVIVALMLAGVLAYVWWPGPSERADDADFDAFEAGPSRDASDPDGGQKADITTSAAKGDDQEEGSVVVLEDRVADLDDEPARASSEGADAGRRGREGDAGYVDPVNEQVLGPKSWMPELPEEKREEIDRELDEPPPEQFPLDLGVRREGIEVAKAVVFDCYDALQRRQPGRTGRIIVAFDVVASGSNARLRNVEIPTNVKLGDPTFETCIIDGLDGLVVPAADQGEMHVEYPFLFDLEGKR